MVKSKSMIYMQCTGCCEWRHKTNDKYSKKIFERIAPEVETKAKVFSEISASCSQSLGGLQTVYQQLRGATVTSDILYLPQAQMSAFRSPSRTTKRS